MRARATILIVDDEPINIEMLAETLGDDYEIVFATGGAQALIMAETARPDLVLLDVVMPRMDGFEVCQLLKQNKETAGIPVIFATALGDSAAEIRGLELGAVDFITKPINPLALRVRVRNNVELKQARDRMLLLAATDGLTGLANRRTFDERLTEECRRLPRTSSHLSLIFLDIDHFKAFNDTYGHPAGDACLREIGAVLVAAMRRSHDLAARYGGEEFACVLPTTHAEGAAMVARHISAEISRLALPHAGSPVAPYVTASVGVFTITGAAKFDAAQLLAAVDECLYRAKAEGRNRVIAARCCPA